MLQGLGNKTKAFFVQLLLGLIALSFVAWGFTDFNRGGGSQYAITVGKKGIPLQQVENAVRQRQQDLRGVIGQMADQPVFKQQITQNVVQQLINRALYVQGANDLGVLIAPELQREALLSETAFQENGQFDRLKFDVTLQGAGLSEDRYLNELTEGLQVQMLAKTIEQSVPSVNTLTAALWQRQNESRRLRIYKASLPKVKSPDEETLQTYLNDNREDFQQPQVMDVAFLHLQPKELAKTIDIPEKSIQQRYDAVKAELGEPERRTIKLLLTDSEADAKAVFKSKKDFKELVAAKGSRRVSTISNVTIDGLPSDAVGKAVFAAKKGERSTPAESSLGWHVALIENIEAGKTVSYEEAKADIQERLSLEQAYEQMTIAVENLLDEEGSLFQLPGGVLAGQAVEQINGKNFTQITNQAFFKKNPDSKEGLRAAMNEGLQRIPLANDTLLLLEVKNKRAAPEPVLADIRKDVAEAYQLELAKKQAQDVLKKGLASLEADKAPDGFKAKITEYLKNDQLKKAVGGLTGQIQQSSAGEVFDTINGNGITIVKVLNLKRQSLSDAERKKSQAFIEKEQSLQKTLVADVLDTLGSAYRREYPVIVKLPTQ